MAVLVGLPLLALLLLFRLFRGRSAGVRASLLDAALVWGVLLTLFTELLSWFDLLIRPWVAAAWTLAVLLLLTAWLRQRPHPRPRAPTLAALCELPPLLRFSVDAVVVIVAILGLLALLAPPNTWDAMAYHMARVAHWLQNRTVRHYPTCFLPQLYQGPWAEFVILHLQILSGGDRFANCVQWFSMIGSIVGVSLIAELLGAGVRGQIFAAVVAATIPMGVLQGSSTQNDFVAAFWLVCFAYHALRWLRSPSAATTARPAAALALGTSLGLALLTKGTAYVYAAPLVVVLGVVMVRRWRASAWRCAPIIGGMVVLLNLGHYVRNLEMFGSPIATGLGQERYTNEVHTLAAFASNVIRNVSLHLGTPFGAINDRTDRAVRAIHAAIGMDVDDPRTTSWGAFRIHRLNTFEDSAGNPAHLLLFAITIVGFLLQRTAPARRLLGRYLALVAAAFALFCVLLKWQPWHSRLQLPLFVLLAPFAGVVLAQLRSTRLVPLSVVGLCVAALPWLLWNKTRLLVPTDMVSDKFQTVFAASRTDQYFSNYSSRHLRDPYLQATAFLKQRGVVDVGLVLPYDPWEYQLWVLLQGLGKNVRVEQVGVHNVSAQKSQVDAACEFKPAAIVRVRATDEPQQSALRIADDTYVRRWSMELVDVYLRE